MKNIAIIGCGNLGISIAQGLIESEQISPEQLFLTRRNVGALSELAAAGAKVSSSNASAADASETIILAVKPYNIAKVIAEMAEHLEGKLLISLASGVEIEEVRNCINMPAQICRVMPNIASSVGESISLIAHQDLTADEIEEVKSIFDSVGRSLVIEESLMEAATVLGACGIAYVMRFMRGMIQGGVQIGFSASTAKQIVTQTVLGAATMLLETDSHPEAEIDKVTTPKGCTIVGLNEMEHNGFSSSLIKGIVKSYDGIVGG
jgi:pyrroline-5-carboxylate reductase